MKRGFGVIELLIGFLMLSILVAIFLNTTLIQVQESKKYNYNIGSEQVNSTINDIEVNKQKSLKFQEELLRNN